MLSSFDLHVLCAPPAFILSQDQTLILNLFNKLRFALSDFFMTASTYKRIVSLSLIIFLAQLVSWANWFDQCYNSHLIKFDFIFWVLAHYNSVLLVVLKLPQFYWFLKRFIVYFSMYFVFLTGTYFIILSWISKVNTFFKIFSSFFSCFFHKANFGVFLSLYLSIFLYFELFVFLFII